MCIGETRSILAGVFVINLAVSALADPAFHSPFHIEIYISFANAHTDQFCHHKPVHHLRTAGECHRVGSIDLYFGEESGDYSDITLPVLIPSIHGYEQFNIFPFFPFLEFFLEKQL